VSQHEDREAQRGLTWHIARQMRAYEKLCINELVGTVKAMCTEVWASRRPRWYDAVEVEAEVRGHLVVRR
jgi:hypothetical protein